MPTKKSEDLHLILSKIHLQGFKSIEDLQIDLKPGLNVLIGKNGSGKSNFLDCTYRVTRLTYRPGTVPSFRYAFYDLYSSDSHKFSIEHKRTISKRASEDETSQARVYLESNLWVDDILKKPSHPGEQTLVVIDDRKAVFNGSIRPLLSRLGYPFYTPLYIRFNIPSSLECLEVPGTIKISIGVDDLWDTPDSLDFIDSIFSSLEFNDFGESVAKKKNLTKSTLLKKLKIEDEILDNLKQFSPIQDVRFNENINIYKDDKSITIENIKLDLKVNNSWLPWSQLSDGTKRLFYLISEITHKEDGLILIEEPELGIHPHQFNLVMNFLKEQSVNKQIIISTHSPTALNHLDSNELDQILIASYSNKKGTQIKRLSTTQKNKANKYMKEVGFLSDYWLLSDLE